LHDKCPAGYVGALLSLTTFHNYTELHLKDGWGLYGAVG
jgi:hypothetical protein